MHMIFFEVHDFLISHIMCLISFLPTVVLCVDQDLYVHDSDSRVLSHANTNLIFCD